MAIAIAALLQPLLNSQTGTQPFVLPKPTGTLSIGVTWFTLVDESRDEAYAGAGVRRQVRVNAWYPASRTPGLPLAPYLLEGLSDVRSLASLAQSPGAYDHLAGVETHAQFEAPPAASPARFPLLIFSHGFTGHASGYTALLEDLASHGYVVLSVVHPYEAMAATLADGTTVTAVDASGQFRQSIRDVFSEWGKEDQAMAAVTATTDHAEQVRRLRGYLSTLPQTNRVLRRWVDDTAFALDSLASLPAGSTGARLTARIDMTRVGAFGHSMGGVTSAQFCVEDARCRAALNLDGIPQYGQMIDRPARRPFLMVYSARAGRTGASDAIYRQSTAPYYRVDVRDTKHLEFSDMPFWGGPLRDRGAFGAIAPTRAAEITRTIVREFFDQELNGRPSPLLAGKPVFEETTARKILPIGGRS
jgi:predicted dienelactone hydrolase